MISPFLTVKEAAEYLRCHQATVYRLIADNQLTAHSLRGKKLIHSQELERYLKRSLVKSA